MQWSRVSNKGWQRRKRAGGLRTPPLQNRVTVFSAARELAAKLPEAEKQAACWMASLQESLQESSQESLRVRQELSRGPALARASKPVQGSNCPVQRPYPCAAPWQRRRA